jgi:tight adherence protein B
VSSIDFVTVCAFAVAAIIGVMVLTAQNLRGQRVDARIQARVAQTFFARSTSGGAGVMLDGAELFKIKRKDNVFNRWASPKLSRLTTVAGSNGLRIVIGAGILAFLAAMAMVRFMTLPDFATPMLLAALPVVAIMQSYRFLVERFKRRFLEGFPDLLDLIVRAVRAGVPVTHVISSVIDETPEPLRTEFKLMGDSLQLGIDLQEVLAIAVRRIEIADFSFFCVCLLLQRETGGPLGETLENLAAIVRTRREIRQKTKAMTGEARITTKILAAIPVIVLSALYLVNRPYVEVLFQTTAGNKLATFATISIVLGIGVINKMAKLDTSR